MSEVSVSVVARESIRGFRVEIAASVASGKYLVNVTADDGKFPYMAFNQQEVIKSDLPKAIQNAHEYIDGYKQREEDSQEAVERWLGKKGMSNDR